MVNIILKQIHTLEQKAIFIDRLDLTKKKNNKSLEGPDSESSSAGNHQRRSFKLLHWGPETSLKNYKLAQS